MTTKECAVPESLQKIIADVTLLISKEIQDRLHQIFVLLQEEIEVDKIGYMMKFIWSTMLTNLTANYFLHMHCESEEDFFNDFTKYIQSTEEACNFYFKHFISNSQN